MQRRSIFLFITLVLVVLTSACTPPVQQRIQTAGLANPKQINSYEDAGNLWRDMAKHFNLPDETADNPRVKEQIDWYMSHQKYLQRAILRAQPYLYYIYQQVRARDLPAELALLPMIESAYNPFAINGGSGAAGLWQMMPGTATGYGLHLDWWYDGRRDITASTNAALDYLAYLGNYFNGDWLLAIAAYDTGEGNVQQAIARNARSGEDTDFWDLHLARETQDYVPKILAFATIIKHPDLYPVDLPEIKNAPYLAEVDVGGQIDLAKAAKLAGISLQDLSKLNPGFNRWATDPNGPYKILLPVDHVAQFVDALNQNPSLTVTWQRVKVGRHDTLLNIAARYHTSSSLLQEVNHLRTRRVRYGQSLLVPAAPSSNSSSTSTDQTDNTSSSDSSNVTALVENHEKVFLKGDINHIPEPDAIHHTVATGETIYDIAREYHVSSRDIIFWNNMQSNDVTPGQDIIIWPSKRYNMEQTVKTTLVHYKVRAGDTLYHIAHKFGTTVDKLKKANHLHSNSVTPGRVLSIPGKTTMIDVTSDTENAPLPRAEHVTHTVHASIHSTQKATSSRHNTTSRQPGTAHAKPQHTSVNHEYKIKPGDTVYKIARLHHLNPAQIVKVNHFGAHSNLKPGEEIRLP